MAATHDGVNNRRKRDRECREYRQVVRGLKPTAEGAKIAHDMLWQFVRINVPQKAHLLIQPALDILDRMILRPQDTCYHVSEVLHLLQRVIDALVCLYYHVPTEQDVCKAFRSHTDQQAAAHMKYVIDSVREQEAAYKASSPRFQLRLLEVGTRLLWERVSAAARLDHDVDAIMDCVCRNFSDLNLLTPQDTETLYNRMTGRWRMVVGLHVEYGTGVPSTHRLLCDAFLEWLGKEVDSVPKFEVKRLVSASKRLTLMLGESGTYTHRFLPFTMRFLFGNAVPEMTSKYTLVDVEHPMRTPCLDHERITELHRMPTMEEGTDVTMRCSVDPGPSSDQSMVHVLRVKPRLSAGTLELEGSSETFDAVRTFMAERHMLDPIFMFPETPTPMSQTAAVGALNLSMFPRVGRERVQEYQYDLGSQSTAVRGICDPAGLENAPYLMLVPVPASHLKYFRVAVDYLDRVNRSNRRTTVLLVYPVAQGPECVFDLCILAGRALAIPRMTIVTAAVRVCYERDNTTSCSISAARLLASVQAIHDSLHAVKNTQMSKRIARAFIDPQHWLTSSTVQAHTPCRSSALACSVLCGDSYKNGIVSVCPGDVQVVTPVAVLCQSVATRRSMSSPMGCTSCRHCGSHLSIARPVWNAHTVSACGNCRPLVVRNLPCYTPDEVFISTSSDDQQRAGPSRVRFILCV